MSGGGHAGGEKSGSSPEKRPDVANVGIVCHLGDDCMGCEGCQNAEFVKYKHELTEHQAAAVSLKRDIEAQHVQICKLNISIKSVSNQLAEVKNNSVVARLALQEECQHRDEFVQRPQFEQSVTDKTAYKQTSIFVRKCIICLAEVTMGEQEWKKGALQLHVAKKQKTQA